VRRPGPSGFTRAILIWTACLSLLAVVVAVEASWALIRADQACFIDMPTTPCPGVDDPAMTRLVFALVGVPLVWFVGTAVSFGARDLRRRRSR
jgi:hypothetical protein